MSQQTHYYTPEGFAKAKRVLQELKTKDRHRISREMAEARAKGDLSENAEFHAAKEAQELLEKKIMHLEIELRNARIIEQDRLDRSQVGILSKVKVEHGTNKMVVDYTLVPPSDADFKRGKISVTSPIGKGLLGKKVGESACINVPAGKITLKILEIGH